MRKVGTLANEAEARRLADYLLTLHITTRLAPEAGGCDVWVHQEDRVPEAARELEAFRANPSDARYQEATGRAREIRKQAEKSEREHRKNTRDVREIWSGPSARRCPATFFLIAASIAVYFYTGSGTITRLVEPFAISRIALVPVFVPGDPSIGGSERPAIEVRSEGLEPIREGQIWRLFTPILLHFGFIHLLFNMYMLYILGSMIEIRRGTARMVLLVLVAALVSNLGQFAWSNFGNPRFGGMSGVCYALLGYIWMKREYEPELGLSLSQSTIMILLAWMLLGFFDVIKNMANIAHFAGLVVGIVVGLGPHLLGGRRDG